MSDNGFTRFPNWLIDDVMPNCNSSEWAIVCAVVRATSGWGKDCEKMSIADLSQATGIKGRQNVTRAVQSLLDKGYLSRKPEGQAFYYWVSTSNESLLVTKDNQSRNVTSASNETLPEVVTNHYQLPPTIKKERKLKKEDMYIAPDPLPVATMKTAISQAVKTPMWEKTERDYDDAAMMLIGWDATPESITAFGEWWTENGWHSGLPELSTMLKEYRNFLSGVKNTKSNGNHRTSEPANMLNGL